MRITVATTFPAWPASDGASLRNFHLYRHVAMSHEVEIVSAVHPARGELDALVAPGLREIRIAVSDAFLAAAGALSAGVGGVPVTDLAMARLHALTPRYGEALRRSCEAADIVVASHPYLAYALREGCDKPLVYEAPDVEVDLKLATLPRNPAGRELMSLVALAEADCCRLASRVLACTEHDRARLVALYALDPGCVQVAFNGADVEGIPFRSPQARRSARGKGAPAALFLASWHGPNVAAARELLDLARSMPQVRFVIAGSVGRGLEGETLPANVELTGPIDEAHKRALLASCDLALNPVESGSGSNVKLPEYCAAGLPVLTTPFGNRGTGLAAGEHLFVRALRDFPAAMEEILDEAEASATDAMAARARSFVERHLSWRQSARIATRCLEELHEGGKSHGAESARLVTFIVPMLDARPFIAECLESVLGQSHGEIEVLVVDDDSSDGSADIVRGYAARDARVRLLAHPGGVNRGVAASIELALAHARGARIALIDADDVHEPRKLEAQMAAMDRYPEAVMCHTGVTVIGDIGSDLGRLAQEHFSGLEVQGPYRYLDRADALSSCRILNSSVLVDARAMRATGFAAPQRFQVEDWLLFALLAEHGPFIHLPDALTRYRVHGGSYTAKASARALGRAYGHLEFLLSLQARTSDHSLLEPIERQVALRLSELTTAYGQLNLRKPRVDEVVPDPARFCERISIRIVGTAGSVRRDGRVEVELSNRGSRLLTSHWGCPTMLSYHWLDPKDRSVVVWDGLRSKLAPSSRPGSVQTYAMAVEWPQARARARELLLRVSPVLEGRFWFDAHSDCFDELRVPGEA